MLTIMWFIQHMENSRFFFEPNPSHILLCLGCKSIWAERMQRKEKSAERTITGWTIKEKRKKGKKKTKPCTNTQDWVSEAFLDYTRHHRDELFQHLLPASKGNVSTIINQNNSVFVTQQKIICASLLKQEALHCCVQTPADAPVDLQLGRKR